MKKEAIKILFDICHPAHVHLFRNYIKFLKESENEVTVVSRDKDVTNRLLDEYSIEYSSISKAADGLIGKFFEFISRTRQLLKLHKKKKFDYAFGTSVSIGILSRFSSNVKSFVFNEDDDETVPFFCMLAYPFATKICNPEGIEYRKWRDKRLFFNSYHELAYLHSANFAPDSKILQKYNLKSRGYAVVRLSSLKAHHDINAKGIGEDLFQKIIDSLNEMPTIVLKEGQGATLYDAGHQVSSFTFQVSEIHNILAFAKILISDSQTMTIEAAVLGVPSVRINSFRDKSTVLSELQDKYQLTTAFLPEENDKIIQTFSDIINDSKTEFKWQQKREKMLKDKIDLTEWMKNLQNNWRQNNS